MSSSFAVTGAFVFVGLLFAGARRYPRHGLAWLLWLLSCLLVGAVFEVGAVAVEDFTGRTTWVAVGCAALAGVSLAATEYAHTRSRRNGP